METSYCLDGRSYLYLIKQIATPGHSIFYVQLKMLCPVCQNIHEESGWNVNRYIINIEKTHSLFQDTVVSPENQKAEGTINTTRDCGDVAGAAGQFTTE